MVFIALIIGLCAGFSVISEFLWVIMPFIRAGKDIPAEVGTKIYPLSVIAIPCFLYVFYCMYKAEKTEEKSRETKSEEE